MDRKTGDMAMVDGHDPELMYVPFFHAPIFPELADQSFWPRIRSRTGDIV